MHLLTDDLENSMLGPDMLPPKNQRATLVNTGVHLPQEVLDKLDAIVKAEGVKSRNRLIASFLEFDVGLFPQLRMREGRLETVERAEGWDRVEVIVRLIDLGLAAYEREKKIRK